LPQDWRLRDEELTRRFSERFQRYKAEIVVPWLRAVKSCHSLICLVDVLTILEAGHPMLNDVRQIIGDLLEVLRPGQSLLGKTIRGAANLLLPSGWRSCRITRIAFAAPKLDLVHPVERAKMAHLVEQITRRAAENHDGLEVLYTNCSSAVSTDAVPPDNGRLYVRSVKGDEKFPTPRLPDDWPSEWPSGDYVFPRRIRPIIARVLGSAPSQVNLDKVFNFVMGNKDRKDGRQ
jgi:predicted YcjX-like family ATPase